MLSRGGLKDELSVILDILELEDSKLPAEDAMGLEDVRYSPGCPVDPYEKKD